METRAALDFDSVQSVHRLLDSLGAFYCTSLTAVEVDMVMAVTLSAVHLADVRDEV